MTREQLLKHWEVIEAFMNGAEVEYRKDPSHEWDDATTPMFIIDREYRIKKQPELIPFDCSDAEKIIGRVVKHKDGSNIIQATIQVTPFNIYIGEGVVDFKTLLDNYTFTDGTPCGKQKQ